MNRLNKFNIHNMFKQKSFYICTIILLALASLGIIANVVTANFITHKAISINSNDTVIIFLSPSSFDLFVAIFIALFYTLDVSNGTMKNIIARGFSRKQVFASKFFTIMFGVTIMFIASFIFAYIVTFIAGGKIVMLNGNVLGKIGICYINLLGIASLYTLISSIVSKPSGALVACILTNFLAPTLLLTIDTLLKLKTNIGISKLWIVNASNNKGIMAIIICVVYILVSYILGSAISSKKEIK